MVRKKQDAKQSYGLDVSETEILVRSTADSGLDKSMRISKAQLQDVINEEVASALLRSENRRLLEAREPGGVLYNVDASELLNFAKAYARLGGAVQEQLEDLMEFQEDADINPNAHDLMEQLLRGMNRQIDDALDVWYESRNGED